MGADVFGTWVHKVLENVDKKILEHYQGWIDQSDVDERIYNLDSLLDDAMSEIQEREGVFEIEKGFNFVLKEVAKTLLESYYQAERTWNVEPVQLLDNELDLNTLVDVQFEGQHFFVKLKGRVDRLDRIGSVYRIIDYKTGKVESKDLKIGEIGLKGELESDDLKGKILQLWLYKFLLVQTVQEQSNALFQGLDWRQLQVEPGIISFRNLGAKVLSIGEPGLWFEEGQSIEGFLEDSKKVIQGWIDRILDRSTAFEKTKDVETCQYCDFKVICHREI